MDARLVAWARRVKARRRIGAPPPLWLFTDPVAHPDLEAVVAGLPRGLCGVVFRHDAAVGRDGLGRAVAAICKGRRLALSVAGDWRLAVLLHAGFHARGGARPGHAPRGLKIATSSAHDRATALRAKRAGAAVVFVSPLFPTRSHPGAPAMGPPRWLLATGGLSGVAAALGGIDGGTARRLAAASVFVAGAVRALAPNPTRLRHLSGS